MSTVLFLVLISVLGDRVSSANLEKPLANDWVQDYPRNCIEAMIKPAESSVYYIKSVNYGPKPFLVSCEKDGWTVIQRRNDANIDFYRDWQDYKHGFGDLTRNFWIGLEKLHALTTDAINELQIIMEDFDGKIGTAKYTLFAIGDESEAYALKLLGNSSGNAGDGLAYHRGQKFATYDKDSSNKCAERYKGAWWYNNCHHSHLNGIYLGKQDTGVRWLPFAVSLKSTTMMIRPKI